MHNNERRWRRNAAASFLARHDDAALFGSRDVGGDSVVTFGGGNDVEDICFDGTNSVREFFFNVEQNVGGSFCKKLFCSGIIPRSFICRDIVGGGKFNRTTKMQPNIFCRQRGVGHVQEFVVD